MNSAKKSNQIEDNRSDFYEANHFEILKEASERICSLYRAETGRELSTEVVSLIFEDGQITEVRTDMNEIIYET
jgi:hypothetical protein